MIDVTALPTMDPVPRARVQVSDIPAGTATLTVWRESRAGRSEVRAAVAATATDPFTAVDYAVPWNEDVSYWADFYDVSGAPLGSSDRGVVRVVFFGTVMHQPLDPTRRAMITNLDGSGDSQTRAHGGDHIMPGAGLPVWIGRGIPSLSTRLIFSVYEERDLTDVERLFGDPGGDRFPPIVCLRTSETLRLPQPFFAVVPDVSRLGIDWWRDEAWTRFEWSVTETSEPALGLLVSPFSYEDIEGWYATYEALEADPLNSTYEALEQRTDLAGVA